MFRSKVGILLIFIAVSLLTRILFIPIEVLDIDETAHVVGSWTLLEGKLLYTDFVDNKPPLLYVYFALAQSLFGHTLIAVHLFTAIVVIPLIAFGASAFFSHSREGVIAGFIFLIYSAAFLAHDMHSTNAEILMLLPGTWALVLARDEHRAVSPVRMMLAGGLIGIGVLLKYQIAAWLGSIMIASLYAARLHQKVSRGILAIVLMFAGFAVPLLITYAVFSSKGGEHELIYWTIKNNLNYASNPILFSEAFERAASYLLPFLMITAPLWWFSWRSRHHHTSLYRWLICILAIVFSIPMIFIGFRFYPHYFIQLYIPLSLASAQYVALILKRPLMPAGKVFAVYTVVILVLFTIANAILYFGNLQVYQEANPVFKNVAARIQKDGCYPDASIFVWGYAPMIYYYTRLTPASRFVAMSQSGLTGYISGNVESNRGKIPTNQFVNSEHWDWFMEDLRKNKATYFIDTAPAGVFRWNRYPVQNYPRLHEYVKANYTLLDEVEEIAIYKRNDCKP